MKETAVFGGGCFWCTEAIFKSLKGVSSVLPGYTGGTTPNPTYEEVSTGDTGHVEVIKIEFDPQIISFSDLLNVFFHEHDPTTLNRQGADVGTQYRSAIFYTTERQKEESEKLIKELNESHAYGSTSLTTSDKPASPEQSRRVVTEVVPLNKFYEAENYHKDYFAAHPEAAYCQIVIAPKLEKLNKKFAELVK